MPPTFANGKICYIEMPATDIDRSSSFYKQVFGWNIRTRGDGSVAFDDGVGEVSGTWVKGRPPSEKPGLLFYIMVDSVAETIKAVEAAGARLFSRLEATRRRSRRGLRIRVGMWWGSISSRDRIQLLAFSF